jgi:hypothetical protein
MTDAVRALAASAALLVIVSGLAKLRTPQPAVRLLAALGLPRAVRRGAVARILGAGEIAVGVGYLATSSRIAAIVLAAAYLGFAATVAAAMVRRTGVPCGCFGAGDAEPGRAHLAVTVLAATVAIGAAIDPGRLHWHGLAGVVLAAQTVLMTCLAWVVLTLLPELAVVRRRLAEES